MDGTIGGFLASSELRNTKDRKIWLSSAFGTEKVPARKLDKGMGEAVGRRTVFRPEDKEDFGRVADRVALGNVSLIENADPHEQLSLRNAIATGALLTSGRHLQHGDAHQAQRNMEVFTNCATAIASFTKFYLLLNGSGVGRAYNDELSIVDWGYAPKLALYLSPDHADYPKNREDFFRFGVDMGLLGWDAELSRFDEREEAKIRTFMEEALLSDLAPRSHDENHIYHLIEDSREGWAKAIEILESMAFTKQSDQTVILDLSSIRKAGSPIGGMQGRPASGPVSLLRGLMNIRRHVIEPARARLQAGTVPNPDPLQPWKQSLLVDHYLSVEVQVGGARRAARMATKSWRDPGVLDFIRSKSEGGLWTANHSVMVDQDFWDRLSLADQDPMTRHAQLVFEEATRCAYVNGEPGFINGDMLEDHRKGVAWNKPVYEDGRDFRSSRYQVGPATGLLAALSHAASKATFPVTTNPCGEITLHVTGGYCVISDFAPLLACPVELESFIPGKADAETADLWDKRVEDSVRLGVRFLLRANQMDALYAQEVARTNRIGIGPTGLHEWAWMRYGYDFHDLLNEEQSSPFWRMLGRLSDIAKEEANAYAAELGCAAPVTVTTVKPAGTTSKLFGLTEGAHLPARRQYLRWVQFKGVRDEAGHWLAGSDPLLADYLERGYPVKALHSFPGMSIVGFPTIPQFLRLQIGDRLVTASEATPSEQYQWLKLLEKYWIGARQGNQVSYTLKVYTHEHDLDTFRDIVRTEQPQVRCCSVLPTRSDAELGYEYLPEEEISAEYFAEIVENIRDIGAQEKIDLAHLQCASGVCPI